MVHEVEKWKVDASYTANKANNLAASSFDYNQLDPQYNSLGLALQDQVANPYAGLVERIFGERVEVGSAVISA